MPSRVKCRQCLGCMIARWVGSSRYYYCDLCQIWYGGQSSSLEVVPSPYEGLNLPKEVEEPKDEREQ